MYSSGVPRSGNHVKPKTASLTFLTEGWTDLHFHGAFGVDLMTCDYEKFNQLCIKLGQAGVAQFAPTTLSDTHENLRQTLSNLGEFSRHLKRSFLKKRSTLALPVGIHLEGPYLNPNAAGAHPPSILREIHLDEINQLWEDSGKFIKIITVGDSDPKRLADLARWAKPRGIRIQWGHSPCSQKQHISGYTHLWNAMKFHHRETSIATQLISKPDLTAEIIPDGKHLSWETLAFSLKALENQLYFVSDATPSAGLKQGKTATFGPIQVVQNQGVSCVVPDGDQTVQTLAGGGLCLPQMVEQTFRKSEGQLASYLNLKNLNNFKLFLEKYGSRHARKFLGLPPPHLQLQWELSGSKKFPIPVMKSVSLRR